MSAPAPAPPAVGSSTLLQTGGFELMLGGLALLLGWAFGPDPRAYVPEWWHWRALGWGCMWGTLAALPLFAAVLLLQRLKLAPLERLNQFADQHLMPLFCQMTRTELIALALAAGVGEELLFRGWLQSAITGPLENTELSDLRLWGGCLVAALVFGAVHFISPTYAILASLAGIYFGFLLIISQNLIVPVTAHFVYDAAIMMWMVRGRRIG
jgi:membrane protease YdiL (CAAX protease family)